jgi:conjugative transfer signal peptidase TraF
MNHLPIVAAGMLAVAAVTAPAIHASPKQLVWNASASLPVGLYVARQPGPLERGDIVLIRLPAEVRSFAARRGYVPAAVPVLKRIAALPGDRICREGKRVSLAGIEANAKRADRLGRPMPQWHGCRTLEVGEIALLADAADSFDSRYFGAVPSSGLVAIVRPVWVRK